MKVCFTRHLLSMLQFIINKRVTLLKLHSQFYFSYLLLTFFSILYAFHCSNIKQWQWQCSIPWETVISTYVNTVNLNQNEFRNLNTFSVIQQNYNWNLMTETYHYFTLQVCNRIMISDFEIKFGLVATIFLRFVVMFVKYIE